MMPGDGWRVLIMAVLALSVLAGAADAITLYVTPTGNDAWSGRSATVKRDKSDGPLATLAGARDAIRRMKSQGALAAPVTVVIKRGTYRVTEPLVLDQRDSGTADCPITYTGEPGREPVISGGRVIAGWRQEGKLWVAEIPKVRAGKWHFEALWVNGRRATRARMPNEGYFYTAGKAAPARDAATGTETERDSIALRYSPGDIQPWDNLEDALVVVYHAWETSLHRIARLEPEANTVVFTGPAKWPFGQWGGARQRYHVENVFEALDRPGEWYVNRKTGVLYYIPRPGEDLGRAEVVAPVAQQLIVVNGDPAKGEFVDHVRFANLRLMHTDWPVGPQGQSDGQAEVSVPAAVQLTGARHCVVERCEMAHLGTYALWFRQGCQDNRAFHNEMHDLGAGGVRIGEQILPAGEAEAAARNVVDNNFIHDGGKIYHGAIGVWIGQSSYHTVSHNEICDLDYTGISVGWSWGYASSSANHNRIEFNHIHHIGRGVLSDLGGIYTLGVSPGTVERYNLIHDSISYDYGGWGIYTDEGSSDILIENNVVYNTKSGGFHQHYGKENMVRNNIFAFATEGQLRRTRPEEHVSFTLERNIVVTIGGRLFRDSWGNGWYRLDHNLYWDYSNPKPDFSDEPLTDWQAKGRDQHSLVADPKFLDPEHYDFRLEPDSPAFQIGFTPIDTSKIGLYGEEAWVARPRKIKRPPQPPFRGEPRSENAPTG